MTSFNAAIDRDANRQVISSNEAFKVSKSMTFAGNTVNDPGDYDGTGNPATLFTVTGDVLATIFGICTVSLTGETATLALGVTDATGIFCGEIAATTILAKYVIAEGSNPALSLGLDPTGDGTEFVIGGGQDIIQTVATANITAGAITYYCLWRPLSSDGKVEAA